LLFIIAVATFFCDTRALFLMDKFNFYRKNSNKFNTRYCKQTKSSRFLPLCLFQFSSVLCDKLFIVKKKKLFYFPFLVVILIIMSERNYRIIRGEKHGSKVIVSGDYGYAAETTTGDLYDTNATIYVKCKNNRSHGCKARGVVRDGRLTLTSRTDHTCVSSADDWRAKELLEMMKDRAMTECLVSFQQIYYDTIANENSTVKATLQLPNCIQAMKRIRAMNLPTCTLPFDEKFSKFEAAQYPERFQEIYRGGATCVSQGIISMLYLKFKYS
jgi:hypothetical protein